DDAWIEPAFLARFAVQRRNADTPRALPGQTPVGPQPHRVADAVARRGWLPAHALVDGLERALAMAIVVDDHEPLLGGAKDHRLMAAPAVGISVTEGGRGEQAIPLAQPGDDVVVGLEHVATHERLGAGGEAAGLVHRTRHLEPGALPDHEVLLAVPGRGV